MVEIRAPFTNYIGTVAEEVSERGVRLSLVTGPQHRDATGRVHTGVLTAIMDSTIGIGLGQIRYADPENLTRRHATIDMSTSFYAYAVPGDEIIFEGRVTHIDEAVAFGEAEARRRRDGLLLAKARLTFAIPPARS